MSEKTDTSREQEIENILNGIYSEVFSADECVLAKAKSVIKDFVEEVFIEEMKKTNKSFNAFYQKLLFTGDFVDGLKVGAAVSEFKLNIVFSLPCYSGNFELVQSSDKDAGFFGIEQPETAVLCTGKTFQELIPKNHPRYKDFKFLQSFFKCQHYSGYLFREYKYVLLSRQLICWFDEIVTKAKTSITLKNTSILGRWWYGEKFSYSKNKNDVIQLGLGISKNENIILEIEHDKGAVIKVELVPVIDLVSQDITLAPSNGGFDHLWSLTHPFKENLYFHEQSCAKNVMKLLKLFRDMQGQCWIDNIQNSHLKTLVMVTLKEDQKWLETKIHKLFIQCIEKLLQCLSGGNLPCYHQPSVNLLEGISEEDITKLTERLEKIVIDVRSNPPITIRKYFMIEECLTSTVDGNEPPRSCSLM